MDISKERWNADAPKSDAGLRAVRKPKLYGSKTNTSLGERLMANKFCSTCNKHTIHRETK
ncbi:LSU ribosomal protein L33P [Geobacillus sp. WSUCF1]|nr:LSU ribosomal protein L33P [Geobacillus sp. WSUCF1]